MVKLANSDFKLNTETIKWLTFNIIATKLDLINTVN